MMKNIVLPLALASSLLSACDGCDQGTGAPQVRLDEGDDPLPVANEGEGEGGGAGGGGGTGSACGELGGCAEDEEPGQGDTGTSTGEGEGEGDTGGGSGGGGTEEGGDTGTSGMNPGGEGEGEGEGEPPPPPPPPVCTNQTFQNGERVAPRILLVVDKSGSMNRTATGYPGTKWEATVSTLTTVVTNLNDTASFGLVMFPGMAVDQNLCAAGDEYVPMQSDAADAIALSLAFTEAQGATPTSASLRGAKDLLDALPAAGGTRAVVLATDGGPNCNTSLDGNTCRCTPGTECGPDNPVDSTSTIERPANCIDEDDAVAATRALNDAGYSVFVVGIPGIDGLEDVMNSLADAGGTARAGDIRYYDASTANNLASALESAAFRVSTCRFDISATVASSDDVTVRINGNLVAHDPSRTLGWDLVDDDTVELFGATCNDGANSSTGVVITTCR